MQAFLRDYRANFLVLCLYDKFSNWRLLQQQIGDQPHELLKLVCQYFSLLTCAAEQHLYFANFFSEKYVHLLANIYKLASVICVQRLDVVSG